MFICVQYSFPTFGWLRFFLLKSFVWPHLFWLVLDRGDPTGDLIAVLKKLMLFFVSGGEGERKILDFQSFQKLF